MGKGDSPRTLVRGVSGSEARPVLWRLGRLATRVRVTRALLLGGSAAASAPAPLLGGKPAQRLLRQGAEGDVGRHCP